MPGFIPVEDAQAMLDKGALVVDVRSQGEWDEAHSEHSVLLPLDQLEARYAELPKEKVLLMVCRSGGRSEMAMNFMRARGYEAHNLGPWQRSPLA
jgi:rhodanese-related sulfurtransferase